MERLLVDDGEKPERIEAPFGGKREIELPLDFAMEGGERIGATRECRDGRRRAAAGPFIAQAAAIETESGKPELLEPSPDPRLEPRRIHRTRHVNNMHGIVRVHLAPADHCRLEQVQLAFHPAPPFAAIAARRELIKRCAPRHQCFLTLYQMSAA